jgi:mannitol/fructose-specific phosphotransferase system IIA component (Ntr-type)
MADCNSRLSDLLTPAQVVVRLDVPDKMAAIAELTRVLVANSAANYDEVLAAVYHRERSMSTAVGYGVAIPHGRAASVGALCVAAAVTAAPLDWQAPDGGPVRLLFMVVAPESGASEHVKTLARIARAIRHDAVRERLVACRTPQEFHQTLVQAETA